MSRYHTNSLKNADVFTIMGSIYAEVARYDTAVSVGQQKEAADAVSRAEELMDFSQNLKQINSAQKLEIDKFRAVFLEKANTYKKSHMDDYLMPFAVASRMRQLK